MAETFGWHQGLGRKLKTARAFYAVVIAATVVGITMDFAGINPVKALLWTAIINGLLAPFLLVGVLLVATDYNLMHKKPSSPVAVIAVAVTTLLMFAAAIGMFVF